MPYGWVAAAAAVAGAIESKNAANKNADSATKAASQEMERAQLNIQQQNRVNAYKEGAQIADYGGSGVALTGSPLDEEANMKIQDAFESQVQYFNGLVSANADTADAEYQKTVGNSELLGGVANGASALAAHFGTADTGSGGG